MTLSPAFPIRIPPKKQGERRTEGRGDGSRPKAVSNVGGIRQGGEGDADKGTRDLLLVPNDPGDGQRSSGNHAHGDPRGSGQDLQWRQVKHHRVAVVGDEGGRICGSKTAGEVEGI